MAIIGDRVPMFKLAPYRGMLIAASLVSVIGYLLSAYLFIEDANLLHNRGIDVAIFTSVIVVLLLIAAYSRYLFRHLHHRRPGYKRG